MKLQKEKLCEDCGLPTGRYYTATTCFNCAKKRERERLNKDAQNKRDKAK